LNSGVHLSSLFLSEGKKEGSEGKMEDPWRGRENAL
jgi:hypothetical protein